MLEEFYVEGYENFVNVMNKLVSQRYDRVIALFCGSLDAVGESWCPDCRAALPLIQSAVLNLKNALAGSSSIKFAFIFAGIDRNEWKGHPNSSFRRDKRLEINAVPTLVLWEYGTQIMRLEEHACNDPQALAIMFSA